jgi:hypothetical protein
MHLGALEQQELDPESRAFYRQALRLLGESQVPILVGGAYALAHFAGIGRHTKDLDVFVKPKDCPRVLDVFARAGYATELTFPHWLGKVRRGDLFVDVIFGSGNGLAEVDDGWFAHAVEATVFDLPVRLCPAEETICSKAFVMERERYDGADIMHLIRAWGPRLDWQRLLRRFGPHWRLLLSHLVLFRFVYPGERDQVPAPVLAELLRRLHQEMNTPPPPDRVCRGTLLSRAQYLVDIEAWGYQDPRLVPQGNLTEQDVAQWTAAIKDEMPTAAEPCFSAESNASDEPRPSRSRARGVPSPP